MLGENTEVYKIRIGRSLLLGLEVLVAADIVKTIAHELSFISLGLLAGLVLVRTFLSWTLLLEIDGRWPWQRSHRPCHREFGLTELSMHADETSSTCWATCWFCADVWSHWAR
jgi:hypothetical protein